MRQRHNDDLMHRLSHSQRFLKVDRGSLALDERLGLPKAADANGLHRRFTAEVEGPLQARTEVPELFAQNGRLRSENGLLREEVSRLKAKLSQCGTPNLGDTQLENARLQGELQRLQNTLALSARDSECERKKLLEENERLRSDLAAACGSGAESRLRTALTKRSTNEELRSAIQGCHALVHEAERELAAAAFRERRAAFENLHSAIAADDETRLEVALVQARLAEVEEEDLEKGEAKLSELRTLTPEQRAQKRTRLETTKRKKDAFFFVKKDDVESLRALLDSCCEVRWRDWKDHAGRSLFRCAQELQALCVQEFLASVQQETELLPSVQPRVREVQHAPPPEVQQQKLQEPLDASSKPSRCLGRSRQSAKTAAQSLDELERKLTENMGKVDADSLKTMLKEVEEIENLIEKLDIVDDEGCQSETEDLVKEVFEVLVSEAEQGGTDSAKVCPDVRQELPTERLDACDLRGETRATRSTLWNDGIGWSSPCAQIPIEKPQVPTQVSCAEEDEEVLRTKALRSVARDDCDALAEVLAAVDVEVWSKWQNKAGQDLVVLSETRGSTGAYSLLASALGLLQEPSREVFGEKDTVWVFFAGEVMPRRATVLEDVPEDSDEIPLEFWDGDVLSGKVDRCLVRKMAE
mmetsp:Transcript_41226/g.109098  ORF Transcript_41226/g.109098 Transcript_41226/m.109098 type:complete len:641 (-) Transcript_41226:582-2504(-)